MNHRVVFILCFCLFQVYWLGAQSWQSKIDPALWQNTQKNTTTEFLVLLKNQADLSFAEQFSTKDEKGELVFKTLQATAAATQQNVIDLLEKNDADYQSFWVANMLAAKGDITLITQLAQLPEVESIQINASFRVETAIVEQSNLELMQTVTTRGPQPVQWGIDNIGANEVWEQGFNGQGIVVGGADTGYEWNHPALKNNYRGWSGSFANHNYNWHDAIKENHPLNKTGVNPCGLNLSAPCDDDNHGTHTMGTMVGSLDNNGAAIGVAPGATWIGCRNMERGWGKTSTYIDCFQWFLAPTDLKNEKPDPKKSPHVINNSWGCPPEEGCNSSNFSTMEKVIANLRSAGIVVVASAGNDGSNGCASINNPAAMFTPSFTVGATDSNDNIAGFSSRGPVRLYYDMPVMKPDVTAPGVNIRSSIKNGGYANFGGTSMAGPHVVGSIALLLSKQSMTPIEVETLLKNTAKKLTTKDTCGNLAANALPNNTFGHGKIDVSNAFNKLPNDVINLEGKLENNQVRLNWQVTGDIAHRTFEIQRSRDLNFWQIVRSISAKTNTKDYVGFDPTPAWSVNYYRLKITDMSGKVRFTRYVAVGVPVKNGILSIYPNPANFTITILFDYGVADEEATIDIISAQGAFVRQKKEPLIIGRNAFILPVYDLPSGIYTFIITDKKGKKLGTGRFIRR